MFWVSASTMLDFVTNGIAADIGDVLGSSKAKFSKAAIDAVTVAGKIKAVPFEQSPMGIYYRPDIFEKAGIAVPTNWDDLRSAAKELTTKKRAGHHHRALPRRLRRLRVLVVPLERGRRGRRQGLEEVAAAHAGGRLGVPAVGRPRA